jgi:hypothetical protein
MFLPTFIDPGPLVQLGCGTISGTLGATCVYPLQVIRTRYSVVSLLSLSFVFFRAGFLIVILRMFFAHITL